MANVIFPFNRRGIFGIKTIGSETTTTNFIYKFEEHPYVQMPYNGLLIVNITSVPPSGAATLPIQFKTGTDSPVSVTKGDGDPLLGADISETGYYILFFDRNQNVLQVINSI